MDFNKEHLDQLSEDMGKILDLMKKIEKNSLGDLEDLRKEIILMREETENRYGKNNPSKTDTQET